MSTLENAIQKVKSLLGEGNIDQAEIVCRQIVNSIPNQIDANFYLGIISMRRARYESAKDHFQTCLLVRPGFPEAHNNLGIILAKWNHPLAALRHFDHALRGRSNFVDAAVNRARVLQDHARIEEAIEQLQLMLDLEPENSNLHVEIGYAFMRIGDFESGRAHYLRACELHSDHAEAHWNLAMCLLTLGDFENGWREYEWRWQCSIYKQYAPAFEFPRWDGSDLSGKRIFLHAEQGFGDTLQFIRYAKVLKKMGATTLFHCPKNWCQLLSKIDGIDEMVVIGDSLPKCDAHASIMSLPYALGTTLESIPQSIPYLDCDTDRIQRWQRFFGSTTSFRVGIAWRGSNQYQYNQQRSIPLASFEAIARTPGVRLLSLQKGDGIEQLKEASNRFPIEDLGSRLDTEGHAFVDTAAVLKCLDLVITCDTAIAHLAGALNVPVWLGLAKVADWRWLVGRDSSPWYPSMKLFRQSAMGNWETVMQPMATELRRRLEINDCNDVTDKNVYKN